MNIAFDYPRDTLRRDAIAGLTVAAISLRRVVRRYRLPQFDMLLALVVVALSAWFAGWTIPGADGKTLVAVTGSVPGVLPAPHIPNVEPRWFADLAPDAVAIAFLGLLEALAIAKSIAHETPQPLDYNRQCLAEGLANLTGGFFQCLPGSGSPARSAINFHAGAATRFSGVLAALFVAIAVRVAAPLSRFVPKPALAALLLLTATRLIDVKRLACAPRATRLDAGVVVVTALSAIAFGLDQAILIGVALSILLFVPRAAKLRAVALVVTSNDVVRERQPSDAPNEG